LEPAINKQGLCSNYLFTPQLVTGDENTSLDHESWKQEHEEEEQDMERSGKIDDCSSDSEDGAQPDQSTPTLTKKVPKPACQTLSQHKLALQQAYLAVLKSPNLRPRVLQSILIHLPSHVLPNISSPLRFADFCTRAYEAGGMTSILALQSLFFLMMDHGLEYPNFYSSLYKLIEPSVFYAKYRTRFFQLVTKCIYSNPILPAYVVAAFMKRMCRCALSAPPTGALYVIALVSNLLRKHPECACLIHRGGVDGRVENMLDPFDDQAQDPQASRAIESSLWELQALEKHYYHAIGTMAKACGTEGEDTLIYDMDQFVQHSYKSLFDQEKSRVGKRSAPLAFVEPQKLFKKGDVFDGIFNFPR
jgi:U3 small nucleolar RNA-associated protein 19